MKRALVWFKTNLRIDDNRPLIEAIAQNDEVIPVYIFDKKLFEQTAYQTKKMGLFRLKFLMECLQELNEALVEKGTRLLVIQGDTKKEISNLVQKYSVREVYAEFPIAYEEQKLQEEIENELWKENTILKTYLCNYLLDEKDLPFPVSKLPDIFTDFRKKVERECTIHEPIKCSNKIHSPLLPAFEIPQFEELNSLQIDEKTAFPFNGGLFSVKQRLNYYLFESNKIEQYKKTRNGMLGSDYSTKFSPWLALGCISPKEIFKSVSEYEQKVCKNDSTYWVIFELWWREYFYWVMRKYGIKLFQKNGIKSQSPIDRILNLEKLNQWKSGQTGNAFIDANMKELNATGFMSNRGRQNVASYLVNDLEVDWRYGAAYFEEQLIDYDVCSNWGNWAYIAGVGNDPRGHRVFNVKKQADDYDKNGDYRNYWTNLKLSIQNN